VSERKGCGKVLDFTFFGFFFTDMRVMDLPHRTLNIENMVSCLKRYNSIFCDPEAVGYYFEEGEIEGFC